VQGAKATPRLARAPANRLASTSCVMAGLTLAGPPPRHQIGPGTGKPRTPNSTMLSGSGNIPARPRSLRVQGGRDLYRLQNRGKINPPRPGGDHHHFFHHNLRFRTCENLPRSRCSRLAGSLLGGATMWGDAIWPSPARTSPRLTRTRHTRTSFKEDTRTLHREAIASPPFIGVLAQRQDISWTASPTIARSPTNPISMPD